MWLQPLPVPCAPHLTSLLQEMVAAFFVRFFLTPALLPVITLPNSSTTSNSSSRCAQCNELHMPAHAARFAGREGGKCEFKCGQWRSAQVSIIYVTHRGESAKTIQNAHAGAPREYLLCQVGTRAHMMLRRNFATSV